MEDNNSQRSDLVPVYNIKAVSRLVGLLPVTLRAWERRYGLPSPQRNGRGYRLYSEREVRLLRWLKEKVDSGLNIRQAAGYLHELERSGQDVAAQPPPQAGRVHSPASLSRDLLASLTAFDETRAGETLQRAISLYSLDQVLAEIIQPCLVEIGEGWHRGETPIATEHFATQFCIRYLHGLLAGSARPRRAGTIVAACAPGEHHQVGLLMLVVMLRWRGWDVRYLGPNLSFDQLPEALAPLGPRLFLFSATLANSAFALEGLLAALAQLPRPPRVVAGGLAFQDGHLPVKPGDQATILGGSPAEMVEQIELMMETRPDEPADRAAWHKRT